MGPHLHRPTPMRRDRRPAHLRRPHHRDRQRILPAQNHPAEAESRRSKHSTAPSTVDTADNQPRRPPWPHPTPTGRPSTPTSPPPQPAPTAATRSPSCSTSATTSSPPPARPPVTSYAPSSPTRD